MNFEVSKAGKKGKRAGATDGNTFTKENSLGPWEKPLEEN